MASQVDGLTLGLVIICGAIFLLIFFLMLIFILRYREEVHPIPEKTKSGFVLEVTWIVAPFFVGIGIFIWSGTVYFKFYLKPPGAIDIYVVAKQWMWKFQHEDGRRELEELHLQVGTPVRLIMTSQDAIHSLFIPAFRIKQDVLPGRFTEMWFQPTQAGEYHLFCAEYCGTDHARMRARVVVLEPARYAEWKASGIGQQASIGPALATRGARLFTRLGCFSCHNPGAAVRAPDLAGVYGHPVGLHNGQSVIADESYLRESILRPNAKITQGFDPVMPPFEGLISEEDVIALVAYIKSLTQAKGREGPGA